MNNKLLIFLTFLIYLFSRHVIAQNVGIGTVTPNTNTKLDICSSNSGLLIPRVALTSVTDLVIIPSLANSLLIYNTAIGVSPNTLIPRYYYWNGIRWTQILSDISNALNRWSRLLLQSKIYYFKDRKPDDPLTSGFVAQDAEQQFLDFIKTNESDKMKAIAYQNFSVIGAKAIQEQQDKIGKQNKQIEKLEQQMVLFLQKKT